MAPRRSANSAPKEKSHRERRREAREKEAREKAMAAMPDEFAEPYEGDTFGTEGEQVEFSLPELVPRGGRNPTSGGAVILPNLASKGKEVRQYGLSQKHEPRGENPDLSSSSKPRREVGNTAADRKVSAEPFMPPPRRRRRHSIDSSSLPDINRDEGLEGCLQELEKDRSKGVASGKENSDGCMSDTGPTRQHSSDRRSLKKSAHHRRNRKHLLELQKLQSEKKKLDEDEKHLAMLRDQKRKANWARVQSKYRAAEAAGDEARDEAESRTKPDRATRREGKEEVSEAGEAEEAAKKPTPEEREARRLERERAAALRERNEKHMQGLREKRAAKLSDEASAVEKKEALARIAREQVLFLLERNRKAAPARPGAEAAEGTEKEVETGEEGKEKQPGDPKFEALRRRQEELFLKSQASVDTYIAKKKDKESVAGISKDKQKQSEETARLEREKWLRMRGLRDSAEPVRIFSIEPVKAYPDIRREFLRRGWVENTDIEAYPGVFDFKWSLKKADIAFGSLQETQICNHFEGNSQLTTKVGLYKNLRSLYWTMDVDVDGFFPRAYDLSDREELYAFIEDFRMTAALSILIGHLDLAQDGSQSAEDTAAAAASGGDAVPAVSRKQLLVALSVCWHRLGSCGALCRDKPASPAAGASFGVERPKTPMEEYSDRPGMTEVEWGAVSAKDPSAREGEGASLLGYKGEALPRGEKKARKTDLDYRKAYIARVEAKSDRELREEIEAVVQAYESQSKQFYLAGRHNAWIVKPGGKSRGRGIKCMNALSQILTYCDVENPLPNEKWVVQKYIERPLLVRSKKFDIRQWVLVSSLKPLTVWFYHGSYIRFAGSDFSLENLDDEFKHLCNNSVQKNAEEFGEAPPDMEGWMWTSEQFVAHLKSQKGDEEGARIWDEMIVPSMKQQVVAALQSCLGAERDINKFDYGKSFEGRKASFEMYGYDFMVDDHYNSWLLEVNSSPAMDHSTPVTEKLCHAVVSDMFELVLDHLPAKAAADQALRQEKLAREAAAASRPVSGESSQDAASKVPTQKPVSSEEHCSSGSEQTGPSTEEEVPNEAEEKVRGVGFRCKDWELIHRGVVPAPPPSYAGDLEIEGIKIERPANTKKKKKKAA